MDWHWVFAGVLGLLAGWSFAAQRRLPETASHMNLWRGLVATAVSAGFVYSGWQRGTSAGLLTLAICLLAAGLAYLAGWHLGARPAQPDAPADNSNPL